MFRSVFVADTLGSPSADLAACADVIHDSSVRTLMARGYVAATEPAQADVILRSAWSARPVTAGRPDGKVSLRLWIEDPSGRVLKTFDAIVDAQAGLLTRDRVSEAVRTKVGAMPMAPTAR